MSNLTDDNRFRWRFATMILILLMALAGNSAALRSEFGIAGMLIAASLGIISGYLRFSAITSLELLESYSSFKDGLLITSLIGVGIALLAPVHEWWGDLPYAPRIGAGILAALLSVLFVVLLPYRQVSAEIIRKRKVNGLSMLEGFRERIIDDLATRGQKTRSEDKNPVDELSLIRDIAGLLVVERYLADPPKSGKIPARILDAEALGWLALFATILEISIAIAS